MPTTPSMAQAGEIVLGHTGVLSGRLGQVIKIMLAGAQLAFGEVIAKVVGEHTRGLAISQVMPYPWNPVDPMVKDYRRLAEAAGMDVDFTTGQTTGSHFVELVQVTRDGRFVR